MEIQPSKPAATRPQGSAPSEVSRPEAQPQAPQQPLAAAADDRLELSSRSQRLAEIGRELDSPERAERLAKIAAELEAGTFNSPERAARSAGRMLE